MARQAREAADQIRDEVGRLVKDVSLLGDRIRKLQVHFNQSNEDIRQSIVSIDKKYPKHAQKVMHAIWGAHMMSLTKLIVVVDADCDVHNLHEVSWRALGNTDYARDLTVVEGPVDHLDHAAYEQFWGGKVGIDATAKLATEGYHRGWPEIITQDPTIVERVTQRWPELGI